MQISKKSSCPFLKNHSSSYGMSFATVWNFARDLQDTVCPMKHRCRWIGYRWTFVPQLFVILWEIVGHSTGCPSLCWGKSLSVRRTSFVILWDIVCHSAGYRLLFYGMSIVILWYIVCNQVRRRSVSKRLVPYMLFDEMCSWALFFVVERNPAEVEAMSFIYLTYTVLFTNIESLCSSVSFSIFFLSHITFSAQMYPWI